MNLLTCTSLDLQLLFIAAADRFYFIPIGSHNTKASSAINNKPYIVAAVRTGYDPFNPATQIRTGPVLQADPPEIQYTIRSKTAGELDDAVVVGDEIYTSFSFTAIATPAAGQAEITISYPFVTNASN